MATDTEKAVIQALLHQSRRELLVQPLFDGYYSEDAVLAAFVDKRLTSEQERAVKQALSANSVLRQQWQAVLAARSEASAEKRRKTMPWGAFGGFGLVASLAFIAVLVWSGKAPEPQRQLATQREPQQALEAKREPLAPANVASAPNYASRPVPISAWQAFLKVYAGEESPASPIDKAAQQFAEVAKELRILESTTCQGKASPLGDEFLAAQFAWALLATHFKQELGSLAPDNDADWCQFGATLKQKAQMAVTDNSTQ